MKDNNLNDDLNLENLNLENLEESDLNELIKSDDINLENINNLEDTGVIESNDILDEAKNLNLGLSKEQIEEFYDYLAGKKPRPIFAEKFFADGESRIKESNQLTVMMGLSFIPKLLALQQSLIDNLSSVDNLKYLSLNEKIGYLQTLAAMSTKFNDIALKYNQAVKDFSGVPLIYRQLLDQLLTIPGDKLPRLKLIPKIVDLPDDIWDRIIEISNL